MWGSLAIRQPRSSWARVYLRSLSQLWHMGRVIREAIQKRRSGSAAANSSAVEEKSSYADLVTETDQECERIIVRRLKEAFPGHKFIGEEEVRPLEKTVSLSSRRKFQSKAIPLKSPIFF